MDRVRQIVADLNFSHSGDSEWVWPTCMRAGFDLNIARNEFKYHCKLVKGIRRAAAHPLHPVASSIRCS